MSEEKGEYMVNPPPADSPVGRQARKDDETYLRVLNAFMVRCVDLIDELARQHTFTDADGLTDSGAISADADALIFLAEQKRFRIVRGGGRMVVGYWPENEPPVVRDV